MTDRLFRLAGLLAIVVVAASGRPVRAEPATDTVALLPLDATARLEIYGQPVATEIARALTDGGIDVVVVGAKMAVPPRAALVIDGTITSGKGQVTLSMRLRDPKNGTVLDTVVATAKEVTEIHRAAEELSGRVLPAARTHLAQLRARHDAPKPEVSPGVPPAPVAAPPAVLLAVTAAGTDGAAMRDALTEAATAWAVRHHRAATPTDGSHLARAVAPSAVAGSKAELGFAFEVLGYTVEPGDVPLARARVRVRVADVSRVVFERVVVTDSIVGDRKLAPAALAARAARGVLDIVEPHVRRAIATWGPRS
jgi:hypothetical protein